jgi:hypothetical protein
VHGLEGKEGATTFLPCSEATAEKMDGGDVVLAEFGGGGELERHPDGQRRCYVWAVLGAHVWVCCGCKEESGSSSSTLNRNERREVGEAEGCSGRLALWE